MDAKARKPYSDPAVRGSRDTLMPVVVEVDPARLARLKASKASTEFFQQNLDKLRELGHRYVILKGAKAVAYGDNPEAAWRRAEEELPADQLSACILVHVPKPGESFFF